jgi:hypothetical protein
MTSTEIILISMLTLHTVTAQILTQWVPDTSSFALKLSQQFMKHVFEIGSGAMMYILSFINICSDMQKLIRETQRQHEIAQTYFYFLKLGKWVGNA